MYTYPYYVPTYPGVPGPLPPRPGDWNGNAIPDCLEPPRPVGVPGVPGPLPPRPGDVNGNAIPDCLERPPLVPGVPPRPVGVPGVPGPLPPRPGDWNGNAIPDCLEPHRPVGVPGVPGPLPPRPGDVNGNGIPDRAEDKYLAASHARKYDEYMRGVQAAKLYELRTAMALKDAKEESRSQALREAEKDYKIREGELLRMQLAEVNRINQAMLVQNQEFIETVRGIAERLNDPSKLFPNSFIEKATKMEDYITIEYRDGRAVRIPFTVLSAIVEPVVKPLQDAIARLEGEVESLNVQVTTIDTELATLTATIQEYMNNNP